MPLIGSWRMYAVFYIRKSTLVRPCHSDSWRGSVRGEAMGVSGHVIGQIARIQGAIYRILANVSM